MTDPADIVRAATIGRRAPIGRIRYAAERISAVLDRGADPAVNLLAVRTILEGVADELEAAPLPAPATRDLTAEERREMAMSLVFAMQAFQPAAEPVLCHHPDAVYGVRETMEAGWGRKVIRVVRCPACPAWAESGEGEPTLAPWVFNAERCTGACAERHTNGPGCLMRPVWPGTVAGPTAGSEEQA